MTTVKAMCVRCKETKEMAEPTPFVMRNDKPAIRGFCPKCETPMFRIGTGKAVA